MDVIYVDELFAVNALADYLLLLLSGVVTGTPLRRRRAALAALLGGAYALLAALPPCRWLAGAGCAVGVSLLLVWAAFGGGAGFWRRWGAFLALSALFAGVVTGAALWSGQAVDRGAILSVNYRVLLLSFGVCYAAARWVWLRLARRRGEEIKTLTVTLAGRSVALPALRDTGNRLEDPVSGRGVVIADAQRLSPLFSAPLPAPMPEDAAAFFRLLSLRPELSGRLRLLPYAGVGAQGGLMLCFRPDELRLGQEKRDALVALSPTPLDHGDYAAIY